MATDVGKIVTRSASVSDKSIVVNSGQPQSQNAGPQQDQSRQAKISAEPTISKDSVAVELASSLARVKVGDVIIGFVGHQSANGTSYLVTDRGIFTLPPDIHLDVNTTVSIEVTSVNKTIVAVITPQATINSAERSQIANVQLALVDTTVSAHDSFGVVALDPLPELATVGDATILVRQVAEYFSGQSSLSAVPSEIALSLPDKPISNLMIVPDAPAPLLSGQVPSTPVIIPATNGLQPPSMVSNAPTVTLPINDNIALSDFRGVLSSMTNDTIIASTLGGIKAAPVTLLAILPQSYVLPNIQPSLLAGGATLPLTSLVSSGRALLASVVNRVDDTHAVIVPLNQPQEKFLLQISSSRMADLPLNAHIILLVEGDTTLAGEKSKNLLVDTQHAKTKLLVSLMNDTFVSAQSVLGETGLINHIPAPGDKLAAQVVFLLHALKANKVFASQMQLNTSQSAPLSRLAASIENLTYRAAAASSDTHVSQSRVTMVPLRMADTLVPLTIIAPHAYNDEKGDEADSNHNDAELEKQFEISVKFNEVGNIRMVGRVRTTHLDIKIRSDQEFPDTLKTTTKSVFMDTLAAEGLTGKLSFY